MKDMSNKYEDNEIKYLLFNLCNYQFNDRNKKKINKFFSKVIYPFNINLGRKNQEIILVDKSTNFFERLFGQKA